ncbi:hypothetical protein L1987_35674 [Smallanthus sonchifolius]|uniref:Uncharacterized protein n=1 Tax=Smallanthus sonchifolius TaxID=185202 RepID=A0ACB9HDR3_9ASTR|nr:hypothetical protein L1987_35674 [Smallanthus sonchifolius]
MFSLQQSGELIYHEIPSSISLGNQQDLMVNLHDLVNMEGNPNLAASKATKRQRDQSSPKLNPASTNDGIEDRKKEHMHRKLVHRETEKKRREDLSKLYASLGGLLPPNFVKMKKFGDTSVKESLLNVIPNAVSVSSCNARSFEIQINSCSIEDGFPLSEILKALFEEGLDVINYTSKKINKRLLHYIQSEANDTTLTDLSMLQQRLTAIANNHSE